MNKGLHLISMMKNQRGVTAIVAAIVMAMLIGFIALAVDVGYLYATRNELQNVADAAALAATRKLGAIYRGMSSKAQKNYALSSEHRTSIVNVAKAVALKNQAANVPIVIDSADIKIGRWDDSPPLAETAVKPNAVKVIARRDSGINGTITTFFARIFNHDTMSVSAAATAALTGQGTGEPELPVGISLKWFERPEFCDQPIKFYPTGTLTGCAGWHNFTGYPEITKPANASSLREILKDMENGTFVRPDKQETVAGEDIFKFIGGNIASAFPELKALFDSKKGDPILDENGNTIPLYYDTNDNLTFATHDENDIPNNPITDSDGNQKILYKWETSIVVYDKDDCDNPNEPMLIVGFVTTNLMCVNGAADTPNHTIFAEVICDLIKDGRGGGLNCGTMGSIPNLVE